MILAFPRTLTIALIATAMLAAGAGPAAAGRVSPPAVGEPVPVFDLTSLDGLELRLADMKGKKAVLLDLWAIWCPPCLASMPVLNDLYDRYADRGFEVIGLAVPQGQNERSVRGFLKRNEVNYPVVFDTDDQVSPAYGTMFVPQYFLIAPDGTLAYQGTTLPEDLEERVKALLETLPAAPVSEN